MEETRANDGLRYIGDGTSLPGIPARDLTAEETAQFGRKILLATGLYAEFETKKVYTPKPVKSAIKKDEEQV